MDFNALFNSSTVLKEHPSWQWLIILVAYLVLAKLSDLFFDRVLRRLASRTRISLDDQLLDFAHTPVWITILLLGGLHALAVSKLPPPWETVLPRFLHTSILLVWTVAAARMLNWLAARKLIAVVEQGKVGRDLFMLLKNLTRIVLLVFVLLWLLSIWHIDVTPLFASAGIAGIAIALAAKDSLANLFGGISIIMDKAYKVGDYIIIDSGERGEVVEIGIRSTRIKTRDDVLITIPNSILANTKIINESAPLPRFRIRVPVGVAYGSDLDGVERILLNVAAANALVAADPEPRARLREFADSSVNFELLCWVTEPALKGLAMHNLLKAIYVAFAQAGVVIPFPQRDVHLVPPGGTDPAER